ncbi:50S ribosomal protein L24e [uncultured archaeon]|nr:50S ribosomal protein L24e [uncultured archaeon]
MIMKCSFCGKEIKRGQGILYVKKDGSLIYFDDGKCQTNMLDLGRKAAKLKWARAGAIGRPTGQKTDRSVAKAAAKAVKAEAKEAAKTQKSEAKTTTVKAEKK